MKRVAIVSILLFLASSALAAEGATGSLFTAENLTLLLGALLAVSELLALIPGVRANSVFQLIFGVLRNIDATGDRGRSRWAGAPEGGSAGPEAFRPLEVGESRNAGGSV